MTVQKVDAAILYDLEQKAQLAHELACQAVNQARRPRHAGAQAVFDAAEDTMRATAEVVDAAFVIHSSTVDPN